MMSLHICKLRAISEIEIITIANSLFLLRNLSTQTSSTFSSSSSSSSCSIKWRDRLKTTQMVTQISSILLQRKNWPTLIHRLNLSYKLITPPVFIEILLKIQTNPDACLSFFGWAETNVRGFKPDLTSRCKLIHILVSSASPKPAIPLFDSLIHSQSVHVVIHTFLTPLDDDDDDDAPSQSLLTTFILDRYSYHGLVFQGLHIYQTTIITLHPPSTTSCNALLDAMHRMGEITLASCFCASLVRHHVSMNSYTWSLVARLLCNTRRLRNAVNMLSSSVCKVGNFTSALYHLNQMQHVHNFTPGFSIYSSVLDGACECGNVGLVELIITDMVTRELLPPIPCSDYNPLIHKLSQFQRSYAAEMLFHRALKEKTVLQNASYGCMLIVFCKQGRVKEAMQLYQSIRVKGISLNHSTYCAFADAICKEEPSEQVDQLLKDVIGRGFLPHGSEFSNLIALHCKQGRWKEAEQLLNMILDKGKSPDSFSCSSLVEHYCANKQVDLAVALKDKIEKMGGNLTVTAYNILLMGLFKERGTGEAMQVFEHMTRQNLLNSTSFSIMVIGLSHKQEMRKAMKIHDEMLKRRLKPDEATYKRLISRFS